MWIKNCNFNLPQTFTIILNFVMNVNKYIKVNKAIIKFITGKIKMNISINNFFFFKFNTLKFKIWGNCEYNTLIFNEKLRS